MVVLNYLEQLEAKNLVGGRGRGVPLTMDAMKPSYHLRQERSHEELKEDAAWIGSTCGWSFLLLAGKAINYIKGPQTIIDLHYRSQDK